MPRPSTVYLAITVALAALTLGLLGSVFVNGTSEAAVGYLFSGGLYCWLFALFVLAAVLQTIRESARAVIAAITAGPDATARAMRRAVRPAPAGKDGV